MVVTNFAWWVFISMECVAFKYWFPFPWNIMSSMYKLCTRKKTTYVLYKIFKTLVNILYSKMCSIRGGDFGNQFPVFVNLGCCKTATGLSRTSYWGMSYGPQIWMLWTFYVWLWFRSKSFRKCLVWTQKLVD